MPAYVGEYLSSLLCTSLRSFPESFEKNHEIPAASPVAHYFRKQKEEDVFSRKQCESEGFQRPLGKRKDRHGQGLVLVRGKGESW